MNCDEKMKLNKKMKGMATLKEIKDEYKQKIELDNSPENIKKVWKEFCGKKYKLNGDARVFRDIRTTILETAMEAYKSYVLDQITIQEYYSSIMSGVFYQYLQELVDNGVVTEYGDLVMLFKELAFVVIKGTDTLGKMDEIPESGLEKDEYDRVGYVVWYNFVEELHGELNLPKVKDITPVLYLTEDNDAVELSVLDKNNFTEFKLKNGEFEYYEGLVT